MHTPLEDAESYNTSCSCLFVIARCAVSTAVLTLHLCSAMITIYLSVAESAPKSGLRRDVCRADFCLVESVSFACNSTALSLHWSCRLRSRILRRRKRLSSLLLLLPVCKTPVCTRDLGCVKLQLSNRPTVRLALHHDQTGGRPPNHHGPCDNFCVRQRAAYIWHSRAAVVYDCVRVVFEEYGTRSVMECGEQWIPGWSWYDFRCSDTLRGGLRWRLVYLTIVIMVSLGRYMRTAT